MIIGIPKEIKNNEFRVSATPSGVHAYVSAGHQVLVEKNAGLGSGISNEDYIKAGAQIIDSADEVWQKADLIQKVKEPIEAEYKRMRKGQILKSLLRLSTKECARVRFFTPIYT
ncbi:MAG: alanine dehydrogenase [Actinomycetota bacterium]